MTGTRHDSELRGLDVPAAVTRGLLIEGGPRRALFTEAAIAASHEAEQAGIGPYPLGFLARHVRAGGFAAALALPEPVIGARGTELVRDWLRAGAAAGDGIEREQLFARWLAEVALLIELRRRAG
ncbi:hypothetical protein [Kitasatospora viridis]|uniref:Uncharacterized protein n=1 Tax=Kitasatospora viridis TaxID=281105 RepID=A0A561SED4_9ACTN|nr:hypothetical protein [Kitasatospora viridis]TWF73215.1 hypothetical protein FHX73_16366 [Kitasatospora viridis]